MMGELWSVQDRLFYSFNREDHMAKLTPQGPPATG